MSNIHPATPLALLDLAWAMRDAGVWSITRAHLLALNTRVLDHGETVAAAAAAVVGRSTEDVMREVCL